MNARVTRVKMEGLAASISIRTLVPALLGLMASTAILMSMNVLASLAKTARPVSIPPKQMRAFLLMHTDAPVWKVSQADYATTTVGCQHTLPGAQYNLQYTMV